jgi:uncharacterized protein
VVRRARYNTVAAWNIAIAHKDLHEGVAYRITKCILSQPNLAPTVGAAARSTLAANATKNTVVPHHLGARRALASGARRDDSRLSQEFLSEVDP